jgi:plastocyanin
LRSAGIAVLVLLSGCGSDDRQAPTPADFVLAKAPTNSGDTQVGIAGRELGQELRVLVTRNDQPAEGVTVYWSTPEGSVSPATRETGADGISSTGWTLQNLFAQQVAFASLEPDGPAAITFTAISAPDPDATNTVLVLTDGNRFEPDAITVSVGDTVNWFWPVGSVGHNILPDDGDMPPNSGAPADHPKFLSFRFMIPGVYHYHCTVHGAPGGVGMAGTVTVLPPAPTD